MTVAFALLTRMDVAVCVAALQRVTHKATVLHVKRLNSIVRYMQRHPRTLHFAHIPYPTSLILISDSSFKKEDDSGHAMRGYFIVRGNSDYLKTGATMSIHILDYAAGRQRHVVRATFSAELFAATDTLDTGLLQVVTLEEITRGKPLTMTEAKGVMEHGPKAVKLCLCVDAMSVYSSITAITIKVPAECSTLLHIKWVRELIERRVIYCIAWIDTRSMLADGLTKGCINRTLIDEAMKGKWAIVDCKVWKTSVRKSKQSDSLVVVQRRSL